MAKEKKKQSGPLDSLQPFLRKRKGALSAAIVVTALATLAGLVPYWIIYEIGMILARGNGFTGMEQLLTLAGIALGAVVVKGLFTAWSTDLAHKVAYDVVYEVRMAAADKLVKVPLGYYDKNDLGKVKHTMSEDMEQLEEGVAHLLPDLVTCATLPIASFIVMFTLDWRMALAVLGFFLLMGIGYGIAITLLQPIQKNYGLVGGKVSSAIFTYVYGMKVIRAFSRTQDAFATFERAVRDFSEMTSSIEARSVPHKTMSVILSKTALLIVLIVGVWLVGGGSLAMPTLVFFILLTMGVGAAVFRIFRSSGLSGALIGSATRSVSKLLTESEIVYLETTTIPNCTHIEVTDVSFAYAEQEVLQHVTLSLPVGTMTALVGTSGAGKTTLARLIPRFWDVSEGAITIGGVDVREMSEETMMKLVSFMLQDAYLFAGTIMENIRLGRPNATDAEVIAAAQQAACHEFIAALPDGYQTEVGEGGAALSGGQRARISLVRALLQDTPILILDEATALVDPENEAHIQRAINGLLTGDAHGGAPKTIITIAHRLGTIVEADQIVVMDEGCVVAVGKHEELLAGCELYQRMWLAYTEGAEALDVADAPDYVTGGGDVSSSALGQPYVAPSAAPYVAAMAATVAEAATTTSTVAGNGAADTAKTADAMKAGHGAAESAADTMPATVHGAAESAADAVATGRKAASAGAEAAERAKEDPFRRLDHMSPREQGVLFAGDQKHKWRGVGIFAIFQGIFIALGQVAAIGVLYYLFEDAISTAWLAMLTMAAMFVLQSFFYTMVNIWSFPLFGHNLTTIRLYLGKRLLKLPFGFFMTKDTSVVEARVKKDGEMMIYNPSNMLIVIEACTVVPLTLIAMLWIDWRLALAALVGVPLALGSTWLADHKLKQVVAQLSAAQQAAGSRIVEYIRGITVIRTLGLKGSQMKSYADVIKRYKEASIKINTKLTPYMAIYNIAFELGLVLVLIVGGLLIEAGTLTVTAYMLMLVFAILFYEPLPLMDYATMKRFSKTTIHHLNDIITPQDMTEPAADEAKQPAGHAIKFHHVTFGYEPAVPVIHDLSLTIPEHGTVAIIGPSGGGKTTLLNLIARFWDVEQGAVTIGGVDVRDMTEQERMQKLAFVFQDVYLFNDTVANNIRYGKPNATMEEVILAARKARCHEFITALPEGYETNVGSGGNLLSGGQKQRISIARAILKEAEVVLLDEATASVDPDNEHYIHAAMAEMARDKTVVVVAHRLNTIAQADMIVVVDNGRIVQAGNHRELIARAGIYRTFWESRRTASHWVMERPATGDLPHAKVDL